MACFSYAGAADLDSLVGEDPIVLDSESESESSSDSEELLLGKRKRKPEKTKPNKKAKKTTEPEKSQDKQTKTSSTAIDLFSDEEDDDLLNLSIEELNQPLRTSSNSYAMAAQFSQYQNSINALKNRKKYSLDLDTPSPSPSKKPTSITINLTSMKTKETMKLRVSLYDNFGKILDVFSLANDTELNSATEIKLDGMPLKREERPTDVGLQEGDEIKIYEDGYIDDDILPTVTQPENDENTVSIIVRNGDSTTPFKLDKNSMFQKLFDGACNHLKLDKSRVTFIFDGEPLDLEGTPEEEDMEDGDIVDVKIK